MDARNGLLIVLIFAAGFLAGVLLTGIVSHPAGPGLRAIFTESAPKPIGPYSQAVQSGDLVFLSGQIGIDPATGNLSGTAGEQTTRAMENLKSVLAASGLGFPDVIQTRIYLTNMSDWTTVNGIYGKYFNDTYPARATVQVAGLPKGANVEIEMVARKR